jgi:hypothetical protein
MMPMGFRTNPNVKSALLVYGDCRNPHRYRHLQRIFLAGLCAATVRKPAPVDLPDAPPHAGKTGRHAGLSERRLLRKASLEVATSRQGLSLREPHSDWRGIWRAI